MTPWVRWCSAANQRRLCFWSGDKRTAAIVCVPRLVTPRVPLADCLRTCGGMLPRRHELKEHQWLLGQALVPPAPWASGAIEPQGFPRIQRDQCLLGRGEARRVKRPRVAVPHLPRLPIIPTVIFGEDHIVQDGAELLSVDPEQDLALGDAGLSREVVARQGDTTVAVGRPRKERMGEFLREHLLGIAPALGGPQDLDRDGW